MHLAALRTRSPSFASDAERWEAVQRRDPGADGHFVYCVSSTGVYCRPSCASRHPRLANVSFQVDPAAAEDAGFRPCLRCNPKGPSRAEVNAALVAAACRKIDEADERPDLDELAAAAGMSRFHFHRIFKSVTGVTPRDYANARRAQRVRAALTREDTITQALFSAGYSTSSRFYEDAPRQLGMGPKEYRDGGRGERVRFAVGDCSLGPVLVAATARGVCAILLGDDPEQLLRDLEDQFPNAELIGADREFEETVARVVGLIDAPGTATDLPLDVRGTAFQRQVWEALSRIPPGKTVSYGEIAAAIGHPGAVRAVGQACASNKLAVAIPCHRVVRADGELSGYRWGIERKRALLARERNSTVS
jgi:AraC family transcriptional regulator of adaptative response/methylated-DNA-[protein]-cysteine methyltransferase